MTRREPFPQKPSSLPHAPKRGRFLVLLLMSGLGIWGGYWLAQHVQVATIEGASMTPTLSSDSQVLLRRAPGTIPRYSLVAFSEESEALIKRVVGLPGDAFFIQGNRWVLDVSGNGRFEETLSVTVAEDVAAAWKDQTQIPPDCFFVLGDQLSVSKDSRQFGWVTRGSIDGQVLWSW